MRTRTKYGNKKVDIDGHTFDSKKEAKYYIFLRDLQSKALIRDLKMQVPFELLPAIYEEETIHLKTKDKVVKKCVQKAVHYVADFVYTDSRSGSIEVVDVKSEATRADKVYVLKKKMMRALLGITITEA